MSGSFEGVLGFGNAAPAPIASNGNQQTGSGSGSPEASNTSGIFESPMSTAPLRTWREKPAEEQRGKPEVTREKEPDTLAFGGGGPGWGIGQKKWRIAAGRTAPDEKVTS